MKQSAIHAKENDRSVIKQEFSEAQTNGFALSPPSYGIRLADTSPDIFVQAKLEDLSFYNYKEDKYEKEADQMADLAVQKLTAPAAVSALPPPQENNNNDIQAKEKNKNNASNKSSKSIIRSGMLGGNSGSPLTPGAQMEMESVFDADFSSVRIHTDIGAIQMNRQIGAKAFTHGSNIYFNEGMYAPESIPGKRLLAHELTHTIQQGAALSAIRPMLTASPSIQPALIEDFAEKFAKYADDIPGYRLLIVIIGHDPLRNQEVARTTENWFRGFISVIPGADRVYQELKDRQIVEKAAAIFEDLLTGFNITLEDISQVLSNTWDKAGIADIFSPLDLLIEEFQPLTNKAVAYANKVLARVFKIIKDALIDPLVDLAMETKGYKLLTKVLGKDPISGKEVKATTVEILEDFLLLMGKTQEVEQMKKRGTLKKTADWLDTQIETFLLLFDQLKGAFMDVWENFELEDWLADPLGQLKVVVDKFKDPITGFVEFGWKIALKVLKFIKDALLAWLGRHLKENLRGFHLLTVVLGKDPITNKEVERSGENLILGFLSLILPDERIQEIKKTGAIQQMIDWIMGQVENLGMSWETIVQLFKDIWNSFSIEDLVEPVKAFAQVMKKFGTPLIKIFKFIKAVVIKVVEVILQIMKFPVEIIQSIVAQATQAFEDIKRDPIQFFLNLLGAVKLGFSKFFNKIVEHLLAGIKIWLFKQLEKAGIAPPEDLSPESILKMVMEILGITTAKIFAKIEKKIGKKKMDKIRGFMDKLTGMWSFVTDVVEGGPAALWEKIQEKLGNLWNTVVGFIKDWIMEKVVNKVIEKLLSMLDPTGVMAVINGITALYDSIRSAIEYFREMLEIVHTFVGGVAEIAKGSLEKAAGFLESALAQGLPVAIGFLANILGLDNLAAKLRKMLDKLRIKVDEALDWLIDKAIKMGSGLLEMGKKAIGAIKNWWKVKKIFKGKDGSNHELYFEGEGASAKLMIKSTPETFEAFIESIKVADNDDAKEAKEKAVAIAKKIDEKKKEKVKGNTDKETKKNEEKKQKDLEKLLNKLSQHAGVLFGVNIKDQPESKIKHIDENIGGDKMGVGMMAEVLTQKGEAGSTPTKAKHEVFDKLLKRREGGRSYYVRGHLLNEHLHGPGKWENMTPLSQKGNQKHLEFAENKVKTAVFSGAIVRYEVNIIYDRSSLVTNDEKLKSAGIPEEKWEDIKTIRSAEEHVPKALTLNAHILKKTGQNTYKSKKQIVSDKSIINPVDTNLANYEVGKGGGAKKVKVSLTMSSLDDLVKNTGLPIDELEVIKDAAKEVKAAGKLIKYQQIADHLKTHEDFESLSITIEELRSEKKNVVLNDL